MEALLVSGPPSEALTAVISDARIVDPGRAEVPKLGGDKRVILGVNSAMVLSGWLASEAFQELTERHESGEIRVLAVQIENAPCALVPSGVPLIPAEWLESTIDMWRGGDDPLVPRPTAVRYGSGDKALAWEQLAVRSGAGEDWNTVAEELGLPLGVPTPGALIEGRFRLLAPGPTTALFAQWEVEDREKDDIATLFVLHPHESGAGDALAEVTSRWRELDHPAITPLRGSGKLPDGRAWYARGGTEGESLHAAIRSERLSLEDRLLVLLDVANGLEAAHAAGMVHGGIDPDKVRLRLDGSAAILDPGMGALGHAAANSVYVAPERLDPNADLDVANDIYGLAALAMLAVHGQPLPYWVARDPARMVASLDVNPEFGAVLQEALSWDPERRPEHVGAIREAVLSDPARTEELARHALAVGRDDAAELLIEHLVQDGADGPAVDGLRLDLARKNASRGDPNTAIATLCELAEATTHPASLWLEVAGLRVGNSIEGAAEAWEAALEAHQTRTEASEALRGLAEHDPDRFLRWGRGLALYTEGEEHTQLAHRLGKAFHTAGDEAAALLWLDRAASGGSTDADLLALREEIRTARGEWSDVVDLMVSQAEQGLGDPAELLAKAARLARRATPSPEPVAELYRKLLVVAPAHAEAHRHLARHAARNNDTAGAMAHYEVLCTGEEATAADHCGHARLLLSEGRREEARDAAQQALELEPAHEVAHRVARRAAQECGDFVQAATHQDRLVELNASTDGGGHADRLVRSGDLHRFDGKTETAIERYEEAIAFTPNHLGAWWGIYAIERGRSEGPPAPLCFGPEEALARLLAELLETSSIYEALSTDPFGTALGERCNPTEMWTLSVAVVDTLTYHDAVGPDFFDRLLDAFPARSERIVAVRNLWSGAAHHTASFPVEECMGWAADGPDFDPTLHRELVYRSGWPRESGVLSTLLDRLMVRTTPLPILPPHTDPGDDEDLLLEAPEIPMLVIGEGESATHHEVESSLVLGPDDAPALEDELALHRHGDRLYLSVREGRLEREDESAKEFRLHGGDSLTWGGVRIRFYRVQDRDALEPVEHTESGAPMELEIEDPIDPVPLSELGDLPAMLFDHGDTRMGIPLDAQNTAVIEHFDGSLVFSRTVPEHYLAVVLFRHGHHYIEQELTNASGFGGRLSARSMEPDEIVMIGSTEFQYRKGPADTRILQMPEPTLAPRPMLILQDGSLLGQPVPLSEGLFRIGRGRNCELQIRTDALLSRVHCRIHGEDGAWFVEDAGSSNGTRVNGSAVKGRHALQEGDQIEIGHTQIDFTQGRPRSVEPAVVEAEVEALFGPLEGDTHVVNPADLDEAVRAASAIGPWTREQAQEKIRVANRAFRVLFSSLDDVHGAGKGQSELQLLIDAKYSEHHGLLEGMELDASVLPVEPVLMALEDRPEGDRRQILSSMLLDLIDRATDVVCNGLPENAVEIVLSRMAHLGHRKSLQIH